jgi:hypothetical protein
MSYYMTIGIASSINPGSWDVKNAILGSKHDIISRSNNTFWGDRAALDAGLGVFQKEMGVHNTIGSAD